MIDVKDWVVIVTGASSGIGEATAKMLAAGGAKLVVNYRVNREGADEVAEACRAAGGEAIAVGADVSDDAGCKAMAQAALDEWGRIDGLVNNAGTTKIVPHEQLDDLNGEDFLHIYNVNVVGPYQMTRAVAPTMKARGRGSIVMVSSIAGVMGIGSSVAYAASKGALNTMTLSLARALAPEIRVNTVCPGFVTGRWQQEWRGEGYDAFVEGVKASSPLNRAGSPEDMAETAIMLLAANANVTGEIILCDSGMHLGAAPIKAR